MECVFGYYTLIVIQHKLTSGITQFSSWTGNGCPGQLLFRIQSWGFMSHSTARVIFGQVLSIVTCVGRSHTKVTTCDWQTCHTMKYQGPLASSSMHTTKIPRLSRGKHVTIGNVWPGHYEHNLVG